MSVAQLPDSIAPGSASPVEKTGARIWCRPERRCYLCRMKNLLLALVAAVSFGVVSAPAFAADAPGASTSLCKKHKKKHHGKKKGAQGNPTPNL
jgi:hypothetical protein